MDELLKLIPSGLINFLGWLTLFVIIVFKDKLLRVFNGKTKVHNPNFYTTDKKLDDIRVQLIKLTTIIDERLPKK